MQVADFNLVIKQVGHGTNVNCKIAASSDLINHFHWKEGTLYSVYGSVRLIDRCFVNENFFVSQTIFEIAFLGAGRIAVDMISI